MILARVIDLIASDVQSECGNYCFVRLPRGGDRLKLLEVEGAESDRDLEVLYVEHSAVRVHIPGETVAPFITIYGRDWLGLK